VSLTCKYVVEYGGAHVNSFQRNGVIETYVSILCIYVVEYVGSHLRYGCTYHMDVNMWGCRYVYPMDVYVYHMDVYMYIIWMYMYILWMYTFRRE